MSKLSSRRTFLACLGLALLSTAIFALSRSGLVIQLRRPVKVTYQTIQVKPDGTRALISTHVRTLAGEQMRRQEFKDGKLYADQYIDRDGTIYGVSHKRRELNPANMPHKFFLKGETAENLMKQKQFNRTEQLLGLTAYVFQIHAEDGRLTNEIWYAPETYPLALREISYRDDGSQNILEGTSVSFDKVGEVRPVGYATKSRE